MEVVQVKKKVCLFGDPGVGKTSLIRRFVLDEFSDTYLSTMGAKVTKKELTMMNKKLDIQVDLTLMIWDVMGQKEARKFQELYLKGAEGVFSVCDITNRESFNSLKGTVSFIYKQAGPDIPIIFMINKYDLIEQAAFDLGEVEIVSQRHNIPYFLTSARTGMNVENAFRKMADMLVKKFL